MQQLCQKLCCILRYMYMYRESSRVTHFQIFYLFRETNNMKGDSYYKLFYFTKLYHSDATLGIATFRKFNHESVLVIIYIIVSENKGLFLANNIITKLKVFLRYSNILRPHYLGCKTNTLTIVMHQMRISTTQAS
jgi:hypothetical protein